MKRIPGLMITAVALGALLGCSQDWAKRTGYETLHNVSDIQNDKDPKYDPGQRQSYDSYQRQREEILREEQPEISVPIVPQPVPP